MKKSGFKTSNIILNTCIFILCCILSTSWADSSQYLCQDSGDSSCTGITMAIGPCGKQNWISTVTYSVVNGNSTQEVFSVDNKNATAGSVTKYMKQNLLWKVDVENDHFDQKLSTYIKITPSGWEFAHGCNKTSLNPGCEAAMLFPSPGTNLSPGCQMTKYTPPNPTPSGGQCGDNTATTTWQKRISIYNNCMDDAYIVLTPPTAADKQHFYNAKLWNKTAELAQMDEMYANPQNKTSALLFRKKITFGESMDISVPDGGIASANFGVLLGCEQPPSEGDWPGSCVIGGIPGMASSGVGTVFEYSAGCTYTGADRNKCTVNPSDGTCMGATDYFDLSMVSGFNVPMSMELTDNGNDCNFTEMSAVADLYDCPKEDQTTIAANSTLYTNTQLNAGISLVVSNDKSRGRAGCMAPEQWLEPPGGQDPYKNTDTQAASAGITTDPPNISDWYACNVMKAQGADKDPETCLTPGCGGPQCAVGPLGTPGVYDMVSLSKGKGKPYTNYVKYLKAIGSDAYAWQFNDDASTAICQKAGATVKVTLCPGPPEQQPYRNQTWAFSNNKCLPDSNTGSYPTLLACMQANFDYSCQKEEVKKLNAKTGAATTAQLNYCKPVPKGQGVPYDVCMKNNSQYCQQTGKTPPNTQQKTPSKTQ